MNYMLLIIVPAILNLMFMYFAFKYVKKIRSYDICYFWSKYNLTAKCAFLHSYKEDHYFHRKMTHQRLVKIALIYTVPCLSLCLLTLTCLACIIDCLNYFYKSINDYFYVKKAQKKLNVKQNQSFFKNWMLKEINF